MGIGTIIIIAVLAAGLGLTAGLLVGGPGKNKIAEAEKRGRTDAEAILEAEKETSARLLAAEKESGARALELLKEEAARQLAETKENAAKHLADAKEEAAKQLAGTKEDAARQLAETKKEAEETLTRTRKEAAEQLQEVKDNAARQLTEAKEEAARQLSETREEAARQLNKAKEEAARQLAETKEEADKRHKDALEQQQRNFDETIAKVQAQMRTTTDEMLKQRQKEFAESSNKDLGQIVNPLKETIDKMKEEMGKATTQQNILSTELKTNMENMMRHSEEAKKSADELARAFKHGSKVQGDWGETVLKELLDSQGLKQGIHYDIQAVIRDAAGKAVHPESGSSLRPDVILHLDNNREVIIDSKVSLKAFMDYANAETEDDRQKALKDHIASVRKHVDELVRKDYSSYILPPKVRMDYVIMFVPHTGALWTALNTEPDLWRNSMEKGVFITDEQNLYAALKIISMTWTQIKQAENHEKIFSLATEMMDRVGQFVKKYEAVGKALQTAQKAYEEGERKLQPGGQSILQTCSKLEKLGARQSRNNPIPQLSDGTPEIESGEATS